MALLAQFQHHPPVIDLGDDQRHLFLFQCTSDNICPSYEYESGAGQAFVWQVNSRISAATNPPETAELLPELWIESWLPSEDQIPVSQTSKFYDHREYFALPEEQQRPWGFFEQYATKFGGVPYWTNCGPAGFPPPPFEYLGQVNQYQFIPGLTEDDVTNERRSQLAAPTENEAELLARIEAIQPEAAMVDLANFGSDGVAYIFLDRTSNPPRAAWYWNR